MTTFALSLHALLSRDDAEALARDSVAPARIVRELHAAGARPGDRVALLYPREGDLYDLLAVVRLGARGSLRREGGGGVVSLDSVRHRARALTDLEAGRVGARSSPGGGTVGRMEPHIHQSPSDLRYRVHDGDQFVAVFEPDEKHLAEEHLAQIVGGRRRRVQTPVAVPRELVLELDAVPSAGRAVAVAEEDPETVHVKQFRDGWRVWHPGTRSYLAGPGFEPYPTKTAAMERARDVMVQIGATAKRPQGRKGAAPRGAVALAPGLAQGGLFAPAEVTPKGGQMGFKFNGRRIIGGYRVDVEAERARSAEAQAQREAEDHRAFLAAHPYRYPDGRIVPVEGDMVVRRHANNYVEQGSVRDGVVHYFAWWDGQSRAAVAPVTVEWTVVEPGSLAANPSLAALRQLAAAGPVAREEVTHKPRAATVSLTASDPRQQAWKFNGRKRNGAPHPSGRRGPLAAAPSMPPYEELPIGRAVSRDDLARRRRDAVEEYEAMQALNAGLYA